LLLLFADWYGRNYVGEYIDDYPENPGPLNDDLIDYPPTGSLEWEEWIDKKI
jgi:hypothetical protein